MDCLSIKSGDSDANILLARDFPNREMTCHGLDIANYRQDFCLATSQLARQTSVISVLSVRR